MKPQTEMEKIAARRIARGILEQAERESWIKINDDIELSKKISDAVLAQSQTHGIHPLQIKSAMMRINRGME
jgi:hypothetical protein